MSRLDTGDSRLLFPKHHGLPMTFRDVDAPDPNFFLEHQATLDDDNFLHHRHDGGLALLADGWHGIDHPADWNPHDFDTGMIQLFVDNLLPFTRDSTYTH